MVCILIDARYRSAALLLKLLIFTIHESRVGIVLDSVYEEGSFRKFTCPDSFNLNFED